MLQMRCAADPSCCCWRTVGTAAEEAKMLLEVDALILLAVRAYSQ